MSCTFAPSPLSKCSILQHNCSSSKGIAYTTFDWGARCVTFHTISCLLRGFMSPAAPVCHKVTQPCATDLLSHFASDPQAKARTWVARTATPPLTATPPNGPSSTSGGSGVGEAYFSIALGAEDLLTHGPGRDSRRTSVMENMPLDGESPATSASSSF